MTTSVISIEEFKKHRNELPSPPHRDFHDLFVHARKLRDRALGFHHNEILVLNREELKVWFHREIADEVFHRKLFSQSVLSSVYFVSDLLVSYTDGRDFGSQAIFEYVAEYEADRHPSHLLDAANAAFVSYAFWPEMRNRRVLQYRKFARSYGPALYMQYAEVTGRKFGYDMAQAFCSIGDIVRDRFIAH